MESNVTSQHGEDGIISAIAERLGIASGCAVEFGASWDGEHVSNTVRLRQAGWKVCLIEGDDVRYASLKRKCSDAANIVCVKAWITPDGENTIDRLLEAHFPHDIDFMSIDIDSDDAAILESMKLQPKFICIEFNPTFPPSMHFRNPRGDSVGSSLRSTIDIANRKGYEFVYCTNTNAFFVRADFGHLFDKPDPSEIFPKSSCHVLVRTYDGRNVFMTHEGSIEEPSNPWSGGAAAFAVHLPRVLLSLPGPLRKVAVRGYIFLFSPVGYLRRRYRRAMGP